MQQTNKQKQLKAQTKPIFTEIFKENDMSIILGFFLLQATTKRAAAEKAVGCKRNWIHCFAACNRLFQKLLMWFKACPAMTPKWSEYKHLRALPGDYGNHKGLYTSYTRRLKTYLQWAVTSKTTNEACAITCVVTATESLGAPNTLHTQGRIWN